MRLAIAILLIGVSAGVVIEAFSAGPFSLGMAIFRAAIVALFILVWELLRRASERRGEA